MLEEQLIKAAKGLALIVPAIFLLRWFLSRKAGSPEEWGERHIEDLKRRLASGEIDQESFERQVRDIRES
ncbi:MAG: SHOCT domain-containing protein [Gammaproteobacteria bacterium]|nr:SHOCT domain-containing protein [Gammaproteobacteria bacterium]